MSIAVQDLLAAPDLPLKIDAVRRVLVLEGEERERFRDEILPHQKGEFINGETIMHSPARHSHNHVSSLITRIIGTYVTVSGNGILLYEKVLCGFSRNDYEPDILWFGPGKTATLAPDTMVYPVPDFIVEILSPSTEERDRGVKFEDYASHGVREYWIVDPDQRTIEQYLLPDGAESYRLAGKFDQGSIEPASFPGLIVPFAAFFEEEAHVGFLRSFLH